MSETRVESGLPGVGELPWGTHFCSFYDGPGDLARMLVPFFRAGLENEEACLWVASEHLPAAEARRALESAVPDLAERMRSGQVEIVDPQAWSTRAGGSSSRQTLDAWLAHEAAALARGFRGLRLNTRWAGHAGGEAGRAHEALLAEALREHRILGCCPYCIELCTSSDVLEAVRAHELAVAPEGGLWGVLGGRAHASRGASRSAAPARERTDEATLPSELGLRSLLEAIPQMVWVTDPGGRPEYFNRRWLEYTGISPGDPAEVRDRALHPDDRVAHRSAWKEALRTGEPFEREVRVRRAGTEEHRWFLVRGEPLRGPDGRIQRWFGTCTDIEDQKLAELALRQADRRKDEFLAMLGHELRNPLSPIFTALHLIQLRGKEDPFATEHEIIERQSRHLTRLVDDLLDVSRIVKGKVNLRRQHVELGEVLARALEQVMPLVEQRFHRLHVQVPREGLVVDADVARLAQVVANLLTNAAKYTEPGGEITVTAERIPEERVALCVSDNGAGIDPALLPRIFDAFAQGEQAIDRSAGGLGLGLPIVHSLVQMLGGTVTVRSTPGQGSEFRVELPLVAAATAPALEEGPPASDRPAALRRVLVVDDNVDAANLLARALRSLGHTVRTALDGPSALTVVEQLAPEVAILDIGLPRMDGYELARALRRTRDGERLLVIALTGYGQDRDRDRSHEAGIDAHLVKPVDLDHLRQILERA